MSDLATIVRENAEWTFGNWPLDEGIGSSDVSYVVRRTLEDAGLDQESGAMVRMMVNTEVNRIMNERRR